MFMIYFSPHASANPLGCRVFQFHQENLLAPKICSPADLATKIPRRSNYHTRPRVFRKGLNLASQACEKGLSSIPTSSPQLGNDRYPCDRLCALKSCLIGPLFSFWWDR